MFEILTERGERVPVLTCFMCDEPIHDAAAAAVVFNADAQEGERCPSMCVHKGSIDGKNCHQKAEDYMALCGGTPGWQEMRDHLIYLMGNCGITGEMVVEAERRNLGE